MVLGGLGDMKDPHGILWLISGYLWLWVVCGHGNVTVLAIALTFSKSWVAGTHKWLWLQWRLLFQKLRALRAVFILKVGGPRKGREG